MRNYLKKLSKKDKILLAGTIVILFMIGGVLMYMHMNPITHQENVMIEEPLKLHDASDDAPLESNQLSN